MNFPDTAPHAISIEYMHDASLFGAGIILEWVPPSDLLQAEALTAAMQADLVIAVLGLSPELEGEEIKIHVQGFASSDRTNIELPALTPKKLQEFVLSCFGGSIIPISLSAEGLSFKVR